MSRESLRQTYSLRFGRSGPTSAAAPLLLAAFDTMTIDRRGVAAALVL